MVDLDRRRVLRTLGVIVAGTAAGLLPAGSADGNDAPRLEQVPGARYETIDDLREINDENFEDLVADGYSVILVYTSRPTTEGIDNIDRGIRSFLGMIEELNPSFANFLRYDTSPLGDSLGSRNAVTGHLKELYDIEKRPSILFFCDGEQISEIDGSAPLREDQVQMASKYFADQVKLHKKSCS
tara:strand:- start:508 stop:1059 length:552 start_codon:yes stop_codon:yes gene_type:complete